MIIGIGTDIIEIERVEKAIVRTECFIDKLLTEAEKKCLLGTKKDKERVAANFAGKEAVSKALGTGFRGFSLLDVEILRDELGKPYVVFHNKALEYARKLGVKRTSISLSHCENYAVAMVILEGSDRDDSCN